MPSLTIPARFNGPEHSGQGGYVGGLLASHIAGPARVNLRMPPPLDTPLQLNVSPDGQVTLHQGDDLVGEARPTGLEVVLPPTLPTLEEARAARENYLGYGRHPVPFCYVCGHLRPKNDGMEVYPGPLPKAGDDGRVMVTTPWEPTPDLAGADGAVSLPNLWGALDCPGGWAVAANGGFGEGTLALLAEMSAQVHRAPAIGEQTIVLGWYSGGEGRKHHAHSAVLTPHGEPLAVSNSLWIQLK